MEEGYIVVHKKPLCTTWTLDLVHASRLGPLLRYILERFDYDGLCL